MYEIQGPEDNQICQGICSGPITKIYALLNLATGDYNLDHLVYIHVVSATY